MKEKTYKQQVYDDFTFVYNQAERLEKELAFYQRCKDYLGNELQRIESKEK